MFKPELAPALSTRTALMAALLSLGLCAPPSAATKDDFKQEILIDSKDQSTDGVNKILIFRDDVHITQGSLEINADLLKILRQDGEGSEVFVATGQPADYQQTMEDGGKVKAEASEIRYDKAKRLLIMTGSARLTLDSTASDQPDVTTIEGDSITFNMELETFAAASSDDGKGRVRTIIQPSTKEEKGTP